MANEERYVGVDIQVEIVPNRCIHSRNCVLGSPAVFRPNVDGAWVFVDSRPAEEVAALVRSCPSGALQYERFDGAEGEAPPEVNTVRVRENGPLAFTAAMSVNGDESTFRATLCRCGASRNKPYCDGSHVEAGFEATGEPASRESQPLDSRSGHVTVDTMTNGPLLVGGPIEVISGTGRTVAIAAKLALCRCGGSANKPFCDGSHAKNGFSAS